MTGRDRQQQTEAVWAEPLTENERALIARVIASGDPREVTRWMNLVLACYDALAARLSGLQDTLAEAVEIIEDAWDQWAYTNGNGDRITGGLSTLEWIEEALPRLRAALALNADGEAM